MAERIAERRCVDPQRASTLPLRALSGPRLTFSPGAASPSCGALGAPATYLAFASFECNIACRYSGRAGGQHMISTAYGR